MIRTFMLTMLVVFLPYVGATIGAPCQGDSDCVTTVEACSSGGQCQCKAGYRIHIYPSGCNPESEPCRNILECMVCNASIGFGTCMCNPAYYEYQGFCYLKGNNHNDTCYTAEGCRDTANLVCSSSSGGLCVCRTGYYFNHYRRCTEKVPLGGRCYMPDACRDDYARCAPSVDNTPACLCLNDFYPHQGSCLLKGYKHNDSCYNAKGCRDSANLVCSNSSGGICVCQTGYYLNDYNQCAEKVPVGSSCYYIDDACIDEHARCNQSNPPTCRCMDGYFEYQGSCILKGNHNDPCYTAEGCRDSTNLVCSNSSGGTCVCLTGFYLNHYGRCTEMPDAPKNLLVSNVTATAFTIWLEKPNEVFGELLGYVLTIRLADTERCVIEYLIHCESGCVNPFPNQTALLTTCPLIIQYQGVSKQDLVMMKRNINTLDPGTVYWVSVAAVSQYGKGFTADINVTTLHEGDLNVGSHLESNSMTTIIIVSIACGTLIVIALMAAGTVIIIKRKRASKCKSEADAGSTYMDLPCKTNEDHYDTLAVN